MVVVTFCYKPLMVLQEVDTSKDLDSSLHVINHCGLSRTVRDQRVALLQFFVTLVPVYVMTEGRVIRHPFFFHVSI